MNKLRQDEESGVNNDVESQISEKEKAEIKSLQSQTTRNRVFTLSACLIMGLIFHFYIFKLSVYEPVWIGVAGNINEISRSIVKSSRPFPELVNIMLSIEERMTNMEGHMAEMSVNTELMSSGVSNIALSAGEMSESAAYMGYTMNYMNGNVGEMRQNFTPEGMYNNIMPW